MAGRGSRIGKLMETHPISLPAKDWDHIEIIQEAQDCNKSQAVAYALKHAPHATRYWEALDAIVPELGTLRLFVSAIRPADKDTQDKQDRILRRIDRITAFAREERDGEGEAA